MMKTITVRCSPGIPMGLQLWILLLLLLFSSGLFAQSADGIETEEYVCVGETIEIGPDAPSAEYCYTWSSDNPLDSDADPGNNTLSCTDCANPMVTPDVTTTYTVNIATTSNSIDVDVVVTVVEFDLEIYQPAVIAGNTTTMIPDADELNLGTQTFVNLDNDDDDSRFDITDKKINGGDDEFIKLKLKMKPLDLDEKKVKIVASQGGADIRMWKTNSKGAFQGYTLGSCIELSDDGSGFLTKELWVEPTSPSAAQQAIILQMEHCEYDICIDEVAITIIGVQDMQWNGNGNGFAPPLHAGNNLDADPNFGAQNNGNGTPINAQRVFSGARAPNYNNALDQVSLQVTLSVNPVYDVDLFLKSYDIDDPSTDVNFVDPNDGGGAGIYSGTAIAYTPEEDNRGQANGQLAGFLDGQDADGIATLNFPANNNQSSIDFTVSTQPGDNYRILINGDRDFLGDTRNQDQNDGMEIKETNANKEIVNPELYASPVLTVWRILHIESDTMQDYTWAGYTQQFATFIDDFTSPTNSGTNVTQFDVAAIITNGDASAHLDSGTPANGQYEDGTIHVGVNGTSPSAGATVLDITANGNSRVTTPNVSLAGIPVELTDPMGGTLNVTLADVQKIGGNFVWTVNDPAGTNLSTYNGGTIRAADGSTPVAITAANAGSVTTATMRVDVVLRDDDQAPMTLLPHNLNYAGMAAYEAAYLLSENDGGGNIANNNNTPPFRENFANGTDMNNYILANAQSIANETANFWVVYNCPAWQATTDSDNDPNNEGALLGATPVTASDNVNLAAGGQGSLIFMEALNDTGLIGFEGRNIAHEVGHQFGLDHGTFILPDGSETCAIGGIPECPNVLLMWWLLDDPPNSGDIFIPRHLNLIRSRVNSPGM